ncbi:unnamed protein product [Orchesella dallaii]|uniref:Gustatory receptor n=1 Tax=Orchesella dallaii TaxID=48710 RepID=A0ABP1RCX6_9HEXA
MKKSSNGFHAPAPRLFYIQEALNTTGLKSNMKSGTTRLMQENPSETAENGDFYSCIRPLLRFGKILGLIPVGNLWSDSVDVEKLGFRWKSYPAAISVLITLILSINALFSFLDLFRRFAGKGGGNATELAFAAKGPLFYLTVLLIYLFFLLKAKTMLKLFTTWRKVSNELNLRVVDETLARSVKVLATVIYVSASLDFVASSLTQFPIIERTSTQNGKEHGFTPLETYYNRSHPFWAFYIPFHPIVAVILLICSLVSVLAWNYADVITIVFSRALYFKFKTLVEETEKRLIPSEEKHQFQKLHGITWTEVRRDHLTLCKLLDDVEAFLSPLIFLSYSINIFFICLQLHQGLTPVPDRTILDSVDSAWTFLHLIFRLTMMSLTASKINEYAHQIASSIQKCSSSEYCKEVERLERMLGTGPLGLSGLGCFVITRAFMLVVISVIFTMEIVLLQTSATGSTTVALQKESPLSKTSNP